MPQSPSPRFPDIQTHWARPFIEALAERGVLRGFEDGTFRPNQLISRAEFASMLRGAFAIAPKRPYVPYVDVPANHWAAPAIQWAYETGFMSGYPGREFRPTEAIPRLQTWVALVGGLGMTASGQAPLADLYRDAAEIPDWARSAIATATAAGIVVNYPDRTQIHSQQPATRAEVASFIYQSLVYMGQASPIPSEWIVQWTPLVQVSHRREFRAAWVALVWNIDFPSSRTLTTQQQQAEIITILDQLQRLNFNAVILQVRPEGDALHNSTLEPWSFWLTGTQGRAPNPLYDPLQFAIAQCRQRNLEIHAWFNPYRARSSSQTVNVAPHLAVTHPDVVYPWGTQSWMDPGSQVVQDQTYNVIMDVLRRHDVDGIHLDDYFYPYPIAGQTFPDAATYQRYQAGGGTLSLNDWRRDNVNRMVQRLATGIRSTKPQVKFGISPFGIYRPGQPPQIRGLDAYDQLFADALRWLQQGWVDYLAPQLYWRIDPPAQSYPVLLEWWADNNPQRRHIYPGNTLSQLDGKTWELSEIERQVAITRQLETKLVLGNIFYSAKAFLTNRQGICDRFQSDTYRTAALPPVMPWLSNTRPAPPQNVRTIDGKLSWVAAPNTRSFTLYRQTGTTWSLQEILPNTRTNLSLQPGTYALCTADRLANESLGVVINIK
ncbi:MULTISPECIES: family 10 glycosylhydrolase [unclassified Leptolyngbya]|uniref:glycoside hydrolase family 10 protein n=1 Tax=unclassified Leptolyngbya TaxID=2650499 RepID=UPI001689FB0F|nr:MULTISPECIES: family 10 glycosylhydrolase [unclassified Leptolyngbya]MBD1914065.1 family 10 glycosylhydrolase [Leptolyngbya sp. FACHB-8]MBD2152985.1 family 10 glycosylhydrolase [Leptolyngbya sp. FACHB-16]